MGKWHGNLPKATNLEEGKKESLKAFGNLVGLLCCLPMLKAERKLVFSFYFFFFKLWISFFSFFVCEACIQDIIYKLGYFSNRFISQSEVPDSTEHFVLNHAHSVTSNLDQ